MPEYIEREVLLKDIEEERPENWTDSEAERQAENDFYKYRGIVEIQPTADVVEVVRCKDCKHRYVPCRCALWYGTADGKEYFIERGDDFSCSYGEKKEGAEE